MKIAVPELLSSSIFPIIAAVELGFFKEEGLDIAIELISPIKQALESLRDGAVEFTAGSAHSVPTAFPDWKGAKLLGALCQNTNDANDPPLAKVRKGAGTLVIDPRTRRGGSPEAIHFTIPALITSDGLIANRPEQIAAAVRALVKTHNCLKADPTLAAKVSLARFSPAEAEIIADAVAQDLSFYDMSISSDFVGGMIAFQRQLGLIKSEIPYDQVVATEFSHYWRQQ